MVDIRSNIIERSVAYSLWIIRFCQELERNCAGQVIEKQLLHSGMSIGANIHEAQGGQTRADFIFKMSLAHKDAHKTAYWLKVIKEAQLAPAQHLITLEKETLEIIKILSSILITMKRKPVK